MSYAKSRFNHEVRLPGTDDTICYNSYTCRIVRMNGIQKLFFDAAPFDDVSDGFLRELAECGMLVEGDELELLRTEIAERRERHNVLHLNLYVNMRCSFACEYCIETGLTSQEEMTREVQDGVVRFVERMTEGGEISGIEIVWFGGEPMLSPGIIESMSGRLIAAADRKGIGYTAAIYTNGYALTEENVRLLERCRVKTARISVDGIGAISDRYRHLKDGGGTYDRIIENIRSTPTDITYRIRCNLNKENRDCFPALVEECRRLEQASGNRIVCSPERMRVEEHVDKRLREIELSVDEYIAVYGGVRDCVVRDEDSDAYQLLTRRPTVCASCSKYGFSIDVSGRVFKCCWDPDDKEGQVIADVKSFDGTFTNTRSIDFFMDYAFPDKPKCTVCKLLPICLGRCPLNIRDPERYNCSRLVNDLDWAVLRLYNKSCRKADET